METTTADKVPAAAPKAAEQATVTVIDLMGDASEDESETKSAAAAPEAAPAAASHRAPRMLLQHPVPITGLKRAKSSGGGGGGGAAFGGAGAAPVKKPRVDNETDILNPSAATVDAWIAGAENCHLMDGVAFADHGENGEAALRAAWVLCNHPRAFLERLVPVAGAVLRPAVAVAAGVATLSAMSADDGDDADIREAVVAAAALLRDTAEDAADFQQALDGSHNESIDVAELALPWRKAHVIGWVRHFIITHELSGYEEAAEAEEDEDDEDAEEDE